MKEINPKCMRAHRMQPTARVHDTIRDTNFSFSSQAYVVFAAKQRTNYLRISKILISFLPSAWCVQCAHWHTKTPHNQYARCTAAPMRIEQCRQHELQRVLRQHTFIWFKFLPFPSADAEPVAITAIHIVATCNHRRSVIIPCDPTVSNVN